MFLLSFVIPCYRSEKTIEIVIDEIIDVVGQRDKYDYEIIAINDCSPDNVYEVLKRMAAENSKIKVINFAKNMGKHAAVLAGYAVATGQYVITLDDDFQCPTYELWRLIEPLELDICDVSSAQYKKKQESSAKRVGSKVNNWMGHIMLGKPKSLCMDNYVAMKAFVAKEIVKYKNPYPYLEGLILRVTNRIQCVPMEERSRGDNNTSGFTIKKSIGLFLNGLTAFSVKPLRLSTFIGLLLAVLGFVFSIIVIVRKIVYPEIQEGYSSIIAVLLLSSGIIMLILGIIGEYVGRIYICINDSPQYIIKETINIE